MPIDHALPVIAVFGSNSTQPPQLKDAELIAAELLAAEIVRAGAVLLTGAEPPREGYSKRPTTVKDVALYAAAQCASHGSPPAWIGVANRTVAARPQWHGRQTVVLTPGWDDRRNFVEAALCDAALAIGGTSQGTASEALFSLYFGRRLIIVNQDPSAVDASPRALKRCIGRKVEPVGTRLAVDRGIQGAYEWAKTSNQAVDVQSLPADNKAAARLVGRLLTPDLNYGPRPDIERLVDEKSWDDFVTLALPADARLPK